MPMPVSRTSTSQPPPRARALTSTLPCCVYRMAFCTRFANAWRSSTGSAQTVAPRRGSRSRRVRPPRLACSRNRRTTSASSAPRSTAVLWPSGCPDSRRDRSSSALNSWLMACMLARRSATSGRRTGSVLRRLIASTIRDMACTGWRRSWLAVARNMFFSVRALSACPRAAARASFAVRVRRYSQKLAPAASSARATAAASPICCMRRTRSSASCARLACAS